jgi:hypothetical protein
MIPRMPTFLKMLEQDAAARATRGVGDVEIGGFWRKTQLSRSYAQAAWALRAAAGPNPDEPDVVAPMVFCARHGVELALKDLLIAYQENTLAQAEFEAHDGLPKTTSPLPEAILREVATSHDLGKLLEWVEQWMPVYVKPGWKELVADFERYEKKAVERFRYSTVGKLDTRSGHRTEQSFDRVVVIPIDKLLERLEVFMKEAAHVVAPSKLKDGDEWSALQDLGMEAQTLAEALYARGLL